MWGECVYATNAHSTKNTQKRCFLFAELKKPQKQPEPELSFKACTKILWMKDTSKAFQKMMCNDKGRIIGGIMSHSTWVQNEGLWSKGHSIMILGFAFKKWRRWGWGSDLHLRKVTATKALLVVWKGKELGRTPARIYKRNNEGGNSRRNEAEINSGTSLFFF